MLNARWMQLILVYIVFFGACAALGIWMGQYDPSVHDEYVYLMQADTYLQGRLANPVHPLQQSFQTFHTLSSPTYASKFPPAPAVFLALGKIVGHPAIGVWVASSLAAVATFWMLTALVSLPFAVFGTVCAGFWLLLEWSTSFWGGSCGALAGALIVGAALRLRNQPSFGLGVLLALGCWLGGFSRPFESVPVVAGALSMVAWTWTRGPWCREKTQSVVGFSLMASAGAAFCLYYNYRVTGSAWVLPYMLYDSVHNPAPNFFWGQARGVYATGIAEMDNFALEALHKYQQWSSSTQTMWAAIKDNLMNYVSQYWLVPFAIPWALCPFFPGKNGRTLVALTVWMVLGMAWLLLCIGSSEHYAAPILAVWILGMMVAMDRLFLNGWTKQPARIAASVLVTAAMVVYSFLAYESVTQWKSHLRPTTRSLLEAFLHQKGGKHLVIVTYSEGHNPHHELVFNTANIDQSKIVWARDLGEEQNRKVREYFRDRNQWQYFYQPGSGKIELLAASK